MTLAISERTEDGKYVADEFGIEHTEKMDYMSATSQVVHWRGCYGFVGCITCNGPSVAILFPGVTMNDFLNKIDRKAAIEIPPEKEAECIPSTLTLQAGDSVLPREVSPS